MYTQTLLDTQRELEHFLNSISPSLRVMVLKHVFQTLIINNKVFKEQHDVINFITEKMETKIYEPEFNIIN